jgi:hypothetical protein
MKYALFCLALFFAGCSADDGEVYIALQSDFADFRDWAMTPLGDAPLAGHPAGERTAYVKTPLPAGAPAYPVGDIIVKTVAVMPDETSWDLFAMAKRGGNYNASGARNWEYFLMKITSDGAPPVITARGASPTDAPGSSNYMDANGMSIPCNNCHGAPGADKTDFVLAPPLEPGANRDGGT